MARKEGNPKTITKKRIKEILCIGVLNRVYLIVRRNEIGSK